MTHMDQAKAALSRRADNEFEACAACLVTYALRTQPLLLCAGKTQPCSRSTKRIGLTHTLRCPGQSAKGAGRSRTLRYSRRAVGIGGARILRRCLYGIL